MPSTLGKRKQRVSSEESRTDLEDAQAIFRRHFEAKFDPLPGTAPIHTAQETAKQGEDVEDADPSGSESASEWDGISDDEHHVEVVDYTTPTASTPQTTMTRREMRAYLSCRPPGAEPTAEQPRKKEGQAGDGDDDGQDEDSAQLLANDLALQRLISESHILSAAAGHASRGGDVAAFSGGRTRAQAMDLRLQKLGSRQSIFAQKSMPMAMRKGIAGAAAAREVRRRREARENGIVLEREAGATKKTAAKGRKRRRDGELGVDMPGMGRMKGGELRLSRRDIRSVEMEGRREFEAGERRRGNRRRR